MLKQSDTIGGLGGLGIWPWKAMVARRRARQVVNDAHRNGQGHRAPARKRCDQRSRLPSHSLSVSQSHRLIVYRLAPPDLTDFRWSVLSYRLRDYGVRLSETENKSPESLQYPPVNDTTAIESNFFRKPLVKCYLRSLRLETTLQTRVMGATVLSHANSW